MQPTIKTKKSKYGLLDKTKSRIIFIILTLSIPLIHFIIFWLYVNFDGILLAFKDARTEEWTFGNFTMVWELLTAPGGEIGIAIRNTMLYFAESFVLLFLNFVVAYFLYKKIWGFKAFRIIFYLPGIVSAVALTTVFEVFIKTTGPLGAICGAMGIKLPAGGLLDSPSTATFTIMAYNFWTGFSTWMLMFTASLSRLPEDVFEAACLDGCKPFRELIQLVLPMIMPMFSTLLVLNFTGLFSASGPILLFTQGKAETTTLAYWTFAQVYGAGGYGGSGSYGLVSAMGIIMTLIAVPLTMLVRWLVERIPTVEY